MNWNCWIEGKGDSKVSNNIKLTSLVKTSGCAAKLGPDILHEVLGKLPKFKDDNLLVGFDKSDDALVYRIDDNNVMIQTVDFFPPMVDDPFIFGQIAAANALSDIYAMGANPSVAMNLLCIPTCLDTSVMEAILSGGCDKVLEAGAIIAGGHTISDPTPKYGLCVTGFAHPKQILTNHKAQTGDVLVLTKPLGIGIMNTALKAELLAQEEIKELTGIMCTLNKYAMECASNLEVHSCTDITGFGLMGHAFEMASGSNKHIEIFSDSLPLISRTLDFASMGIIPEGMYHNLDYLKGKFEFSASIPQNLQDVLFDPQTSGGLLLSMPEKDAKEYLKKMEEFTPYAKIFGQVTEKKALPISIG
ncbi:MAG: selenide, water dikinase SelD [Eubacteriaceae bacterium]|nr:selenide, water dikinase SelD [Eubacteriaceae bacterium]